MKRKPIFIISFDCEGKWGVADHLSLQHQQLFTDKNIKNVYQKIITLLTQYDLLATFAFVGMFALSKLEYNNNFDLCDIPKYQRKWLENFLPDEQGNIEEGWLGDNVFTLVKESNGHEIAAHGFTHVPLVHDLLSEEDAEFEFINLKKVAAVKEMKFKTFVYPRNAVGHVNLLKKYGFIGYRDQLLRQRGMILKVSNVVREFNLLQEAQFGSSNKDRLVTIPAGYMLTWRNRIKKHIPIWVTKCRWRHIVQDAIEHGGVVHLWSHPCNFINGSDQFELFEEVLKVISPYVRRGELINLTQSQYCDILLSQ